MVSFTQLGERLPIEAVGRIAGRLGELANECAVPPVRLIKTIGDAAMLVSPEAHPLVDATFALIDAAARAGRDFPRLRAGAAYGPALNRSGDWYGRTVNLASRITDLAEPNTMMASRELRDAAADHCDWTAIGTKEFKGIGGPIDVFRAEPA
jgi:adenylate cyclase